MYKVKREKKFNDSNSINTWPITEFRASDATSHKIKLNKLLTMAYWTVFKIKYVVWMKGNTFIIDKVKSTCISIVMIIYCTIAGEYQTSTKINF